MCRPTSTENGSNELLKLVLIVFVRHCPVCLLLAFSRRFDRVGFDSLDEILVNAFQRPSTDQGLIEHIFVCRCNPALTVPLNCVRILRFPASNRRRPIFTKLGER